MWPFKTTKSIVLPKATSTTKSTFQLKFPRNIEVVERKKRQYDPTEIGIIYEVFSKGGFPKGREARERSIIAAQKIKENTGIVRTVAGVMSFAYSRKLVTIVSRKLKKKEIPGSVKHSPPVEVDTSLDGFFKNADVKLLIPAIERVETLLMILKNYLKTK